MERLISQFLRGTGNEQYLDGVAFRKFAREQHAKMVGKDKSAQAAGVENMNRLLSSGGAGIATLNQIEGDYEVLNVFRDAIPLDFMEIRPLPVGALPIYRTKIMNVVNGYMGSLAGGGSSHYYITKQAGAQVIPFTFTTEKVLTPNLNNLYDMEKLQLRKDANAMLDNALEILYNNVCINTVLRAASVLGDPATAVTAYAGTGGSFAGKTVYSLNPGVVTAGFPTVNYYDLTTEGGLTKKVFQTVNTHSIQIGRNFSKMYIPQAAVASKSPVWESLQNMATPVALVVSAGLNNDPAKTIPAEMWSEFQKEDFRGSVIIDWFGLHVEVSKQNWLPAGYALLFCDRPAGVLWDRLSLESGAGFEGVFSQPVDAFTDEKSKSKNVATLSADYHLRNFLMLKLQ